MTTNHNEGWADLSQKREVQSIQYQPSTPESTPKKVLALFGTRPEVIKLAPVIGAIEANKNGLRTLNVASGQHTDLLYRFIEHFGIRVDHDLRVMEPHQTPSQICSRVLEKLDPILVNESPDLILVQGDTTTAMTGALAGFHRRIPVGHVEAGLRSGNTLSPYPEEMNRRLISQLATYHFAATTGNRDTLLSEGVRPESVFVTGNPVVDSLTRMLEELTPSPVLAELLRSTQGLKLIVLTTHRRESFGELMTENLKVLRRFVEVNSGVALFFPVHPNPAVSGVAHEILSGHARVHLLQPMSYQDFVSLLSNAWLIVSDSGGVQEEAPTLGKPLLILRENTERPEAIEAGVARLVGGSPLRLAEDLEQALRDENWVNEVRRVENPFGRGDSGQRIARIISEVLNPQIDQDNAPRASPM
jgi:UDP-N-acetylglucosamine 2-epimerase (non-hydrolysing)